MNRARRKITVVGSGPVSAAAAAALARRADVDVALGEAALGGAALAVLEDGAPRRLPAAAPAAVLVVVGGGGSVDAICAATRFPRARVVGTGGVAASWRAARALAAAAGVAPRDATLPMLGGTGEAAFPALSLATVAGAPAAAVVGAAALARAGDAGAAPANSFEEAAAVAAIASAVLDDTRRVLPCAVVCHGEYGIGGAAVAVPCAVGAGGVERVLELPLADDEVAALGRSADV